MGKLVTGDDGFPAEEVGPWAQEKQDLLCRYVDISRGARAKFIGQGKAGATYIDLFCGPGRSRVKTTGAFIDGSCVAAWRKSVEGKAPFSRMFIADADEERLGAATKRLQALGAPVAPIPGEAVDTVIAVLKRLEPAALHFAFIDPYSLSALDFSIFKALSRRKRMDMLVHLSKMDLQRNLEENIGSAVPAFNRFAPGWRDVIDQDQAQRAIRTEIIDHWRDLVSGLGTEASTEMKLVKNSGGQHLYWLLLVAKHELAHKFWKTASNPEKQGDLF
ncbi:three-Cys-motif partner protein TcmP [Bradyrhizobium liaoningense]|uniref:three-Cys-motif partner protein TcmP n=1 Tax=Bradyrhizobium liaoningense TaxID=43992 RepID=UPI001BA9D1D3|nr:three-Cys-motif partner protein TcmP [Bradyrhizobium liaoningense]MBR0903349.1 three-Cys-motif partner protein TcmP [Bradyrhizobium liaoningense]